ncbi:MAG TPA: hypothetical protein VGK67_23565 [Myxococcales bacterium]|jgi:hypothetical protein
MSATRSQALVKLGSRLAGLAAVGHPVGAAGAADRLATALEQGVPAPQALAQASASAQVVEFVERAGAFDLEGLLDRVAPVLGRADARARELRGLAGYVWLLVGCVLGIGAILWGGVVPAMEAVVRAGKELASDVSLSYGPFAALYVFATLLLAGLALALSTRRAVFPFASGRRAVQRAAILGGAAAAARSGARLESAFLAGAALASDPALRRDAEAIATGLACGKSAGQGLLLGPLGAGFFFAAAEHGAGVETLEALADFEENAAASAWTTEVVKAQLLAVALGGFALGSAGVFHYALYSGGLIR